MCLTSSRLEGRISTERRRGLQGVLIIRFLLCGRSPSRLLLPSLAVWKSTMEAGAGSALTRVKLIGNAAAAVCYSESYRRAAAPLLARSLGFGLPSESGGQSRPCHLIEFRTGREMLILICSVEVSKWSRASGCHWKLTQKSIAPKSHLWQDPFVVAGERSRSAARRCNSEATRVYSFFMVCFVKMPKMRWLDQNRELRTKIGVLSAVSDVARRPPVAE